MKKISPKNIKPPVNPFVVLLVIALTGAFATLVMKPDLSFLKDKKTTEISISELVGKYNSDELKEIKIKGNKITAENFKGEKFETFKESFATIADLKLDNPAKKTKVEIADTSGEKMWENILLGLGPIILLVVLFLFVFRKAGSGGEGGPFGFGKSKAKIYDPKMHKTKFSEVAGIEEAKEEVVEIVDFLKNPKKYEAMGAKIPKGVLLVGAPGTGKTLLARAIAGEAHVPFFTVSGSEFVEMFVGVGASRVRDLFKTAKRNAPAIIFIDEIDAIGKQRGSGSGGGHDEREQTLNQILTEMDGFEPGAAVIVLAATNRPDVLDKALLRPGRFDRRVHIDMPDMNAREKILNIHAKNKHLSQGTNLKEIASKTVGYSGAELENVMNEAAIAAVKNRKKSISQENLNDSVEKISMGVARKSRKITDKELKIIAYHEVGHALAGHFTDNCEPVHKISIISRGGALGVTWFLPVEDTYLSSENKMFDEMVSLHGGRMAEKQIFGQMTTGASNDLERISKIARGMVKTYGMGGKELGAVVFAEKSRGFAGMEFHEKEFSEATAEKIDDAVRALVEKSEQEAARILQEQSDLLEKISQDLLKKETISREEFLAYFE